MSTIVLPPPVLGDPPPPTRTAASVVEDREEAARWIRPAVAGLLLATAVLYLWGLSASGWANSFYSAAVQAGSQSWKAFFYGASDAAASITVDKPPASLWIMGLSARIFGVNAWSILVPQALEGVAAVGLLYLAVRRWFGAGAGLLAGAVLAVTPVAALMFRFNNPDALLVLLLTGGAYAMVRALEGASTRWLLVAWSLVGFGFLTKMLQAFLVLPAFALVYLIAAPTPLRRRLLQLAGAGVALVASAGWWVAVVELVPASTRPYIGGSQDDSVLDLIFGYNGLGRLTGEEAGSVGGGTGSRWGATGWGRLFNADYGGQASWLLPAALILGAALLALTWRAARTDRTRSATILWGGWLVVTAAVFSFGQGIIHSYYTVALAPAIGALVGIGATVLWRRRQQLAARAVLAAAMAVTTWWAYTLLGRTPDWLPWLRPLVLVTGLAASAGLLAAGLLGPSTRRAVAAGALVAGLAGPLAYTLSTVNTPHAGALPSAGPAGAGGFGPGVRIPAPGAMAGGPPAGAFPGAAQGGAFPAGGQTAGGQVGGVTTGGGGLPSGGMAGLLNASTPSDELVATLLEDAGDYTWVAATIGANQASGYQLATDESVMPIGGFNGTDPSPTLAEFQELVAEGRIHYFLAGGLGGGPFGGAGGGPGGGPDGSQGTASQISEWVTTSFDSITVGGVTLYDLTAPLS